MPNLLITTLSSSFALMTSVNESGIAAPTIASVSESLIGAVPLPMIAFTMNIVSTDRIQIVDPLRSCRLINAT